MTITLPPAPPSRVWIHSPTWLFASYHWALPLVVGLLMLVSGMYAHRHLKGLVSGLFIVTAWGPILVGGIAGIGSFMFMSHPHPTSNNASWTASRDPYHDFQINHAKLPTGFTAPPRDRTAEITTINDAVKTYTTATPLHRELMPTIVQDSHQDAQIEAARHGTPFLIISEVYTCALVADAMTHAPNGELAYAHVTSATCVQGSKSVYIAIDPSGQSA